MTHSYDDHIIIPNLKGQLGFDFGHQDKPAGPQGVYFSAPSVDLGIYDKVIVCMSGGKDSLACLLHFFDLGVDRNRIELWHHDIDGREGSSLMDWPFMADYNRKLAEAFCLPLYFSWLEGGFEGEMLKNNSYSRSHRVETPDGLLILERDKSRAKPGSRLKFPQISANLQTRWCSSALKIDVGRRALTNQARFDNQKILFITGERREESSNRARYNQFEPHACDRRKGRKARQVDAWRPVIDWTEEQVWAILKNHGVTPPVPYRLGWGRSSCMKCIFNDATLWATLKRHFPGSLDKIAAYEEQFGITIHRKQIPIMDVSRKAKPLDIADKEAFLQALKQEYTLPVTQSSSSWKLPAGAFNKSECGPN